MQIPLRRENSGGGSADPNRTRGARLTFELHVRICALSLGSLPVRRKEARCSAVQPSILHRCLGPAPKLEVCALIRQAAARNLIAEKGGGVRNGGRCARTSARSCLRSVKQRGT